MLLFEVGDNANFGKFAMRHCRIKTGVPGSVGMRLAATGPAIMASRPIDAAGDSAPSRA